MVPKRLNSNMINKKFSNLIFDKRKSDEISNSNIINNKIGKMPVQFRYSCQSKNIFFKNKILNNENKDYNDINNTNTNKYGNPLKKDKKYYLNLLNEIYLNDSHLSNDNNEIKKETSIKMTKKIFKKKTCNFSKLKLFKDSQNIISSKSSKKLTFKFDKNKLNEKKNKMKYKNKSDRQHKEHSKSKLCNKENTKESQNKEFSSDNYISKFKTTEALVKVKSKENYKKLRSSKVNIDEDKFFSNILKEPLENKESNNLNILKSNNDENKLRINKRSRNNENQFENENEKVNLENVTMKNLSNKNDLNYKNTKKKKYVKMYKTCFCCLLKNNDDDSF